MKQTKTNVVMLTSSDNVVVTAIHILLFVFDNRIRKFMFFVCYFDSLSFLEL